MPGMYLLTKIFKYEYVYIFLTRPCSIPMVIPKNSNLCAKVLKYLFIGEWDFLIPQSKQVLL